MKKMIWCVAFMLCVLWNVKGQDWKVQLGEQSPNFVVTAKNGQKTTSAHLKGKVVLLNFFATWCPPCLEELPRLQKEIWEAFKGNKDLAVFVLGREEGWEKLDPFMKTNNYTFPIFPDLKREVVGQFADQFIPRNVVLDRTGKIIYLSIGFQNDEFSKMVKLIKVELEKK